MSRNAYTKRLLVAYRVCVPGLTRLARHIAAGEPFMAQVFSACAAEVRVARTGRSCLLSCDQRVRKRATACKRTLTEVEGLWHAVAQPHNLSADRKSQRQAVVMAAAPKSTGEVTLLAMLSLL